MSHVSPISSRGCRVRHLVIALVSLASSLAVGSSVARASAITDGLTPGVPSVPMPYQVGPGVWNEVENSTGRVTAGIVSSGVFESGALVDGKAASRDGYTMIWNPIGAASWGQYYTNGLYVAEGGQYVLPGSSEVRSPDGTVLTPAPVGPAPTPAPPGGVSAVDVHIINSNGARCSLTSAGWWYGSSSCVGRDVQFTVCFVSSDQQISFDRASWGFSLHDSSGTVHMTESYPPSGVTIISGPSCATGNIQSWHFHQLEPGTSYTIEAWGSHAGQNYTKVFSFATPDAPTPAPGGGGGGGGGSSPTTSATTGGQNGGASDSSSGGGSAGSSNLAPARCVTPACGYAVVSSTGRVHGVIVCSDWCTGQTMNQEYMGCPPGCRLIVQGQQTDDGNVAGWHGPDVIYDESTQRFSLPGGGWIQSGARMDEAFFPSPSPAPGSGSSPTNSASTPIETVDPQPGDGVTVSGTTMAQAYMATSGVLHQSLSDFIWFETTTLVSPVWIGLELPAVDAGEVSFRTLFDPAGARPLYVVGQGSFSASNVSAMNVSTRSSGSRLILVDRKKLSSSRGLLVVEVSVGGRVVGYAASSIGTVKSYTSCAKLRLDYPGGVSSGPGVKNIQSAGETLGARRRPVAHQSLYARNSRLDTDRDSIVCEP